MRYVITLGLFVLLCIVLFNYSNVKNREFYSEIPSDKVDRIPYLRTSKTQECDTLYFISADLKDTSWIYFETKGTEPLNW